MGQDKELLSRPKGQNTRSRCKRIRLATVNVVMKVNANDLIESYYRAASSVHWKESVQRYEIYLPENILKLKRRLEDGTYEPKPFTEFEIHERGRTRWIKSHCIEDRVVQRYVCDFILLPKIQPKLIYRNGASQKGKGISFQRKQFENDIHRFYRKYGRDGYLVFGDFSKFFDNIDHEIALAQIRPLLNDDEFDLIEKLFRAFEVDLSFLPAEEFKRYRDGVYNSVKVHKPKNYHGDKSKMLKKSVGIGSQLSQAVGIFYPTAFDNYMTCVLGVFAYGRYTDDFYIMAKTEQEAKEYVRHMEEQAKRLDIYINKRKTRIIPLTSEFTYLKTRYILTENGRLIRKIPKETLRRERKRLRKFEKKIKAKEMTNEQAEACYRSWRGTYKKYDSGYAIRNMDIYFDKLCKGENNGRKANH